ncbi:MAG: DNA repair protein RecN [Clostridia bacterium]|nr:DNA repair protein RecN [Clostridia bacterium]
MLLQLGIHNLALIDEVLIEFSGGMNVLTGETGAGKSIVVDAVNLVLGERADRDLIANGRNKAVVEAVFDITENLAVQKALAELEIAQDEGTLSVSRELMSTGRNICRVNGVIVPLQTLRRISDQLLDIHGQHEHQLLLDAANHLSYLDHFAADDIELLLAETAEAFEGWHGAALRLAKYRRTVAEREQRKDMLRFQLEELENAKLTENEEESLEQKRVFFRNSGKIQSALDEACYLLCSNPEGGSTAVELLRESIRSLSGIASYNESYDHLHTRLNSLSYEVEDAARELENLRDESSFDTSEAEYVEGRIDQLKRLSRKYGATTAEMIAYRDAISKELAELDGAEEQIEALEKTYRAYGKKLLEKSRQLSRKRHEAALQFEAKMEEQLHDLGMKHARITVRFEELREGERIEQRFTSNGFDQAEMMFCANLGQPMKPLAKVASGGELSRIMLALKNLSAQKPGIPRSMVFDEIDTGISGRMAQVVAEKMSEIGDHHQVICVSHLPQIAAMADEQFLVRKFDRDGVTHTEVTKLMRDQRIAELARMVGGADAQSESSIRHAGQMLADADSRKAELRAAVDAPAGQSDRA